MKGEKHVAFQGLITTDTDTTIIAAPTDGRRPVVDFIHIYINAAGSFSVKDTAGTPVTIIPTLTVAAQQGFVLENAMEHEDGVWYTLPNQGYVITTAGGCQIAYWGKYRLVGN